MEVNTVKTVSVIFYNPVVITNSTTGVGGVIGFRPNVNYSYIGFGNVTMLITGEVLTYVNKSPTTRFATSDAINIDWHHVAITSSTPTNGLFLEGSYAVDLTYGSGASTIPVDELTIGASFNTGSSYVGLLSEVRLSSIVRSDAFLKAESYNLKNTPGFLTFGTTIDCDEPPVITGAPNTTTVGGCSAADAPTALTTVAELEALPGGMTINDACTDDEDIIVTHEDNSSVSCPIVVTRTYTLTDLSGSSSTFDHIINVEDTVDPIPPSAPALAQYTCVDLVPNPGNLTATDNCSDDITVTGVDSNNGGAGCPSDLLIITRTWTFTDDCDNSDSTSQTIIVNDYIAPTFTVPDDITIYKDENCNYNAAVDITGDVTDEADNCDATIDATFSDAVADGTCEGEQIITRTWSLTDDCGNTITHTQTITVEDTTAPTFTVPGDITIYKDENCNYDAAVGITGDVTDEADNCDATLDATFSDAVADGTCEGEQIITRTWSLTDDCGNTTTHTQTITVEDNTAPTFTVPADITIYKDENCNYDAAVGITGDVTDEADNCDATLDATFSDDVADGTCEGEQIITRTWSLTDDCGNTTTQKQTITVEDNTAPTFTVPEDITIYKDEDCNYDAAVGITGDVTDEADNCDATLDATFSDAVADGTCEGEQIITRTWSLTDDCGNTTTQKQTITVEDNTAPTFTVPEDITIYKDEDCNYDAAVGITGDVTDEADNCDATLDATFSDAVADGTCEGEQIITRTWSLTDDCGNTTTQEQTITVEDNTCSYFHRSRRYYHLQRRGL